LMGNLGIQIGQGLGLSEAVSLTIGAWTARFVGLSMFLSLTGAFFTLTYSPLKTLIQGAPKEIWPGKLGEIKNGMPINAMKVQAGIVMVMILLVSFGGSNASKFFTILTLMTNVAMTIPYMFLAAAFPAFKKKQLSGKLESPFMVYKSQAISTVVAIVVTAVIGFANAFTIVEPLLSSPMRVGDTIAMIGGPLTFSVVGIILFSVY
ncbi:MAG: glutamate/gamma-aminobutyrate family transporter YjeM, partial [Clostridium sp.]